LNIFSSAAGASSKNMTTNPMVDELETALQRMMSNQEIGQRFKKVFGREMTTSEREDLFLPLQVASSDQER
jgi:hypothetical protein